MRRGISLIEVTIGMFLLALFTTMVAQLVVMGYRTRADSTARMARLRDAAISMERMGRELRLCKQVYVPDPAKSFLDGDVFDLQGQTFIINFESPIASGPTTEVVVGYRLQGRELSRVLYDPFRFDPSDTATWVPVSGPRTVATEVLSLTIKRLDRTSTGHLSCLFLDLRLRNKNTVIPLQLSAPVISLGSGT